MAKLPKTASPYILRVALPVPLYRLFDYLAPADLDLAGVSPGARLLVPFGNTKKVAYLIEICKQSELEHSKLKTVEQVLDKSALISVQDLRLLLWASAYYHHPAGEVISAAFPAELRKGKPAVINSALRYYVLTDEGIRAAAENTGRSLKQRQLLRFFQEHYPDKLTEAELAQWSASWRTLLNALKAKGFIEQTVPESGESFLCNHKSLQPLSSSTEDKVKFHLNAEQETAISAIVDSLGKFAVYLLEGVTGSGKTEVYMQTIVSVLERGQQVLMLVPEINLTPQLEARFRQRFPVAMTLFHSNLTGKQRLESWLNMQTGNSSILLGTRSALFTPMRNLGLIILDEEHDTSFKQQEGFRFSARDVAIMRAKLLNIPVVLGSATPSLESLHNANQKRFRHLRLTKRAGFAVEPSVLLLDIRNKKLHGGLSEALVTEIKQVLANGEQVLLFLNRRGFAPTLICHHCGWVARCLHCDANLVIHNRAKKLRCHHCEREQAMIAMCPACKTGSLMPLGLGTERIEQDLTELFPDKNLIRLDRDTTKRKGKLEQYLSDINSGQADIVIGTQMLAKGHHFANVTLVALVDVDSALFSIDYRAAERLAQMIVQVSGRAGREHKKGKVVLQTRQPGHPLLTVLIRDGYRRYAEAALQERKAAALPPFTYQALLRAQADTPGKPLKFLQSACDLMTADNNDGFSVLGPSPAPMEKRSGFFRYQLLFQSGKRQALQHRLTELIKHIETLDSVRKVKWSLDVDPADLY